MLHIALIVKKLHTDHINILLIVAVHRKPRISKFVLLYELKNTSQAEWTI